MSKTKQKQRVGRPNVPKEQAVGEVTSIRFEGKIMDDMEKVIRLRRLPSRNWFVNRAVERFIQDVKKGTVFI